MPLLLQAEVNRGVPPRRCDLTRNNAIVQACDDRDIPFDLAAVRGHEDTRQPEDLAMRKFLQLFNSDWSKDKVTHNSPEGDQAVQGISQESD